METVTYKLLNGTTRTVEYDPQAPCWACGQPVLAASMGGTVLCPWCDCGNARDGRKLTLTESLIQTANWHRSVLAGRWDGPATPAEVAARQADFMRIF
jgi:hypothetical protein